MRVRLGSLPAAKSTKLRLPVGILEEPEDRQGFKKCNLYPGIYLISGKATIWLATLTQQDKGLEHLRGALHCNEQASLQDDWWVDERFPSLMKLLHARVVVLEWRHLTTAFPAAATCSTHDRLARILIPACYFPSLIEQTVLLSSTVTALQLPSAKRHTSFAINNSAAI